MKCTKKRHRSKKAALHYAKTVAGCIDSNRRGRAYRCPVCHHWHLTTQDRVSLRKQLPAAPRRRSSLRSPHCARTKEEALALAEMLKARRAAPTTEEETS